MRNYTENSPLSKIGRSRCNFNTNNNIERTYYYLTKRAASRATLSFPHYSNHKSSLWAVPPLSSFFYIWTRPLNQTCVCINHICDPWIDQLMTLCLFISYRSCFFSDSLTTGWHTEHAPPPRPLGDMDDHDRNVADLLTATIGNSFSQTVGEDLG